MARLVIHPDHRDWLQRLGLRTASDFLNLSGVIICGHPDRNVARVELGCDGQVMPCYLKKEHRVRLRDRLANLIAGFGFVSKAYKEYALQAELTQRAIAAPEVIAAGESGGQAFLLTRAAERASELRRFLREEQNPRMRRLLARQLGATLARMHQAGLVHRDLYAKHVLVEPCGDGFAFRILDWQRARLTGSVAWGQRCRDLATLHATLADELATLRERLACLLAYVRACSPRTILPRDRAYLASLIHAAARRHLRKRHIRELRQPPLPAVQQSLVWLDGEALCLAQEFRDVLRGAVPAWLPRLRAANLAATGIIDRTVALPHGGSARLLVRQTARPFRWLWNCLRLRTLPSPELEQAATIYRLQRHGVLLPRVLALGQCWPRPWLSRSFLLIDNPDRVQPLGEWCKRADERQRRHAIANAVEQLRCVHQAGYYFRSRADLLEAFAIVAGDRVMLRWPTVLCRAWEPSRRRAARDMRRLLVLARSVAGARDVHSEGKERARPVNGGARVSA